MFNYIRDFDAFDLRLRLPAVVSKLLICSGFLGTVSMKDINCCRTSAATKVMCCAMA